jgi:hypothetical protein
MILVGYRTRLIDGADKLMPAFTPPANYKDHDKIDAYVKNKQQEWRAEAGRCPYVGTFDAVVLVDLGSGLTGQWSYKGRKPGGDRPPVCLAVQDWLLQRHPDAWPDELMIPHYQPEVVFLGFDPRCFLKMLGIECSLPGCDSPLPLSMWYGEAAARGHRDVEEACIPRECRDKVGWPAVLGRRGIAAKDGWSGPGVDPAEDVRLVAELAAQLGLAPKPEEEEEEEEGEEGDD